MAAHVYWRLAITANNGGTGFTTVVEVQLKDTPGGADLTGPGLGSASASSNYSGAYSPDYAFDNHATNRWGSGVSVNLPHWLQYQFNTAADVVEYTIQGCINGQPSYSPAAWTLEYSDNGSSWTTADTQTGQYFANAADVKTYSVPVSANLEAQAQAQASASAALDTGISLAATATGAAAATGDISQPINLDGIAQATTSATGDLSAQALFSATATGEATGSAALDTAINLSGDAVAQAASTGIIMDLAGEAEAQAASSAALDTGINLAVDASGEASATGDLDTAINLAGGAQAEATASGNLSAPKPLEGAAYAQATASGSELVSWAIGTAALWFEQGVNGYEGLALVQLSQTVQAQGTGSLWLEQDIIYPVGTASLWLEQTGISSGTASLWLSQHGYNIDNVALSWANWDVAVIVGGVDISAQLTGQLSIDAERNAARIARFTVILSGAVNVLDWAGKPVTVDYIQATGESWRRFTGVIVEPVLNIRDKTLSCTCSDDLQAHIDMTSNAELLALASGKWSDDVFSADQKGWDYLQDALSTGANSVEFDSRRILQGSAWKAKITPDYSYDESIILDQSLSVTLAQRSDFINSITVNFDAQYTRLFHRSLAYRWSWPRSYCQTFGLTAPFPSAAMVRSAIDSAGLTLTGLNYDNLWPSGIYYCSGSPTLYYNLNADGAAIMRFSAHGAMRWEQNVTQTFTLTILAPESIAAYGAQTDELSASVDYPATVVEWGGELDDFSGIPLDFTLSGTGNDDGLHFSDYYRDEIDYGALNDALATLAAQAQNRINAAHRTSRVTFDLPLAPYLELSHTIAVNDADVAAKGVITRLSESYDFESAEAITHVELAISSGQTAINTLYPAIVAPSLSAPGNMTAGWVGLSNASSLPTHIGGLIDSPALPDDWKGFATSQKSGYPGSPQYPHELRIPAPAVNDSDRLNKAVTTTYSLNVQAPTDTLTITA